MKKLVFAVAAITAFAACKQNPKTSEAAGSVAVATPTSTTRVIDPEASTVTWTASKVTATHTGKISISEGIISMEGDKISAGKFTIDMKTITNDDIKDESYKAKFLGHIASKDFFMVDSFPTATFEISRIEAKAGENNATHEITGNLTIKNVTRSITFPAKITADSTGITASGKMTINRTEWGIIWGGKEDKNLMNNMKDDVISNVFYLDFNLVTRK